MVAYDADPARSHPAVERVASAAAVAAEADVIVLSLPSPAAVDDTMAGILETARPGTVIVDTSTVDPGTNRRWHEAARAKGRRLPRLAALGRRADGGRHRRRPRGVGDLHGRR